MSAEAYHVLGQVNLTTTDLTAVYTVPARTSTVLSSVVIANRSPAPVAVRLAVAVAGAADDLSQYLLYDLVLLPNDALPFRPGATLGPTDVLRAKASTASAITVNVFGAEVT